MKTSKIQTIAKSGSNQWNGKELTKWFVLFENGENGTLTTGFQDNETVPVVGDEMEYEITDKGFGNEVKPARKGGSGGGGFKSKAWTPDQVAQQDAIKLTVAAITSNQLTLKDYKQFFVECKEFMIAQVKGDVQVEVTPVEKSKDDLPF